jgi:hypothetical protein
MVTYSCSTYSCPDGGRTFEDEDQWRDHLDKKHPKTCTKWMCDNLAAYKYQSGRGNYYYCADHAAKSWPNNETMRGRIKRVKRTVNEEAERLPYRHPLEQKLREMESEQ